MKLITNNYRLTTSQKGFTLIELLVVIFITTIISTISIANFRAGEKQKRTKIASDTITNALRNAQNLTLTSKQIANTPCGLGKAPQAYLLTLASSSTPALY